MMLLADIGNTHFHIFDGSCVEHLSYDEALERYKAQELYYISVQHQYEKRFRAIETWHNVAEYIVLPHSYETMGVDRQALCKSVKRGILVDAGSAITVDSVKDGVYQGGCILPGIKAYLKAYEGISSALKTTLNSQVELSKFPFSTRDAISYGIIASIKTLIATYQNENQELPLYFTGGDGAFLATFFKDALFDETLVFKGLQQALKEHNIC
jgi:type III pantothenate kinase